MKCSMSVVSMMVAVLLAPTACKKKEPSKTEGGSGSAGLTAPGSGSAPAPAADALEGQLDLIAWPGYIERGETDKAYDWVTAVREGHRLQGQRQDRGDLRRDGRADEPGRLRPGDRLGRREPPAGRRPRRCSRSTSRGSRRTRPSTTGSRAAPWYNVDGKSYGVPYQWGPNVLLYNTKAFKEPPTSWAVVFEEQKLADGKTNKGRVQAYDGPIYVADAALYLMKKKPELGITDPYELSEAQYAAVLEVLRAQKKLAHRYWHDATVQMSDFKNEGVVASSSWGYMVNALVGEKQPVASTIPAEGSTGWADTTMLHADAKHPNCAYKWMEWSLEPAGPDRARRVVRLGAGGAGGVQGQAAARAPTPARSTASIGSPRSTSGGRRPATCKQGTCVPYSKWVTDYVAIMGGG